LPDLSSASQFGGFEEYMLSCHNGYGNQADVCECVSALDGPLNIAGPYTPGDLDHQVDFYPVFRASAAYHQKDQIVKSSIVKGIGVPCSPVPDSLAQPC
jgi:hypothetical protein